MRSFLLIALSCSFLLPLARAEWERTETSLAWKKGGRVLWRFSFDPQAGKPHFDPLTGADGASLTQARPADHPWHYGLWFSWKYINGANFWEESRETGRAEAATRWNTPQIETSSDGSATIVLELTYTHPSGRVDVTEHREVRISAPDANGSYTIDWHGHFTAGPEGALFERTPMPHEPDGRINGGYGGLGLRMALEPEKMPLLTPEGEVTTFAHDRARPSAPVIACNLVQDGRDLGGVAIVSDPKNAGANAPWYIAKTPEMRFICAAVLAPKPVQLGAGETWELRYRIVVKPTAWTPHELRAQAAAVATLSR